MIRRFFFVLAALLVSKSVFGVDELTPSKYEQLLTELRSSTEAPWRTIPWQTRLIDAQRIAAREAKPIFIWAMDGHPLGCT